MGEEAELEFFGVRIKCKSPHLAALLNSNVVSDDVVVVGRRARDVIFTPGDSATEPDALDALEDYDGPVAEVIPLRSGNEG